MTPIACIAKYLRSNYHRDLRLFYASQVHPNSSILELNRKGSSPLGKIFKKTKIATDINDSRYPQGKFDYILFPDSLSECHDIQETLKTINRRHCTNSTRLIINYHNFLWLPLINLAETIGVKSHQGPTNWLNQDDISQLLQLEGFEIIKTGHRFLLPVDLGILSTIVNRYVSQFPLIKNLCLVQYIIARPVNHKPSIKSVSIIIPAKNEANNIKPLVNKIPKLAAKNEIIFVESGSKDDTWNKIQSLPNKVSHYDIKRFQCKKLGKAQAVLYGFSKASGDLLMILDADQTVDPINLKKFFHAASENQGELIIGSRLVYPLERESMRALNILANRIFSVIFTWLLNQKIKDTLCGTKVISKYNYQKLLSANRDIVQNDPFGDFFLLFGSSRLNLKILEVPVHYHPRQYGQSNISRFHHGLELLKMVFVGIYKIKYQ